MSLQIAAEKLVAYRRNPAIMVRELFGVTPDLWQDQVLEDFPHVKRQAMGCCKGPGKTATLAWLGWNILLTRDFPKIGAISITGKNLDDNLWPEMAYWQKKSPVLMQQFEWTAESIHLRAHPENWFMTRKTWKPTADTNELGQTLAGLWAKTVLFLFDEAGGIPPAILRTAEAALQREGTEGHIVMAGNTTSTEGCLYDALVTHRADWVCYQITGDPDDPHRSPRINPDWARKQIAQYGRDDPWVMINILARFPSQGINQLIGADQVRDCMGRHLHPREYNWAARIMGGDVADFGDDRTILFPRQGLAYFPPRVLRQMDPVQIAGHWGTWATDFQADSMQIDSTGGYGSGPIAILRDRGFTCDGVQYSETPLDPKFYNKRAEILWKCAEHIKSGASLPTVYLDAAGMPHDIGEIVAEMSAPTYSYKGDKIIVEPKDLIKKRLGRSPDFFDAAACTHAYPVATPDRTLNALAQGGFDLNQAIGKSKADYDPLNR